MVVRDGRILGEGFAGGLEHCPGVGRIREGLFERLPETLGVGGVLERLDRRMHRLRLSRLFEVGAVARKHLFRNPRGVALLAAADFVVLRLVERKADFFRRVGEELFGVASSFTA